MSNLPKMNHHQAKLFWNSLTKEQKLKFNDLLKKLEAKELQLTYVGVDDNEMVKHVVLEHKDKDKIPEDPYAKYLNLRD